MNSRYNVYQRSPGRDVKLLDIDPQLLMICNKVQQINLNLNSHCPVLQDIYFNWAPYLKLMKLFVVDSRLIK